MATADYIISNQSGASFRTDLNNTLAAIVSNNSNSSSPSTTYAYQWWADTSTGILKIRNSANNAWIELLQLDGTLTLEDGSASSPALAFRDDLNTGIFSSAADTFNVATGGVERMELGATTIFNEDGADVDFRIEGDSEANLFYVDAGNERIGLTTSSPRARLDLGNGISVATSITRLPERYQLLLDASDTSNAFGNNIGFILNGGSTVVAAMNAIENGGNGSTGLSFATSSDSSSDPVEALRIDASGRLLLGSTDGATYADSSNDDLIVGNTSSGKNDGITILSATSQNGSLAFADEDANTQGLVGYVHNGDYLRFHTGGSIRVRIDSDGIKFGTDSGSGNGLSDYEEGDFTFHLRSEGGSNASMSGRVGRYVKIGQTVHIIGGGQYSGDPDSRGSGSAIEFTNLPFTNISTGLGSAGLPFPVMLQDASSSGMSSMNGSQPYTFVGRLDNNATSGRIVALSGSGDQNPQNASLACVNNTQLYVMFTYQTTA